MKKIINNPSNFVEESIEGLVKSHPKVYAFAPDNKRVIARAVKSSKKVVPLFKDMKLLNNFLASTSGWIRLKEK